MHKLNFHVPVLPFLPIVFPTEAVSGMEINIGISIISNSYHYAYRKMHYTLTLQYIRVITLQHKPFKMSINNIRGKKKKVNHILIFNGLKQELEKKKEMQKWIPNHRLQGFLPFHDSPAGFWFLPPAEHIAPLQKQGLL